MRITFGSNWYVVDRGRIKLSISVRVDGAKLGHISLVAPGTKKRITRIWLRKNESSSFCCVAEYIEPPTEAELKAIVKSMLRLGMHKEQASKP